MNVIHSYPEYGGEIKREVLLQDTYRYLQKTLYNKSSEEETKIQVKKDGE